MTSSASSINPKTLLLDTDVLIDIMRTATPEPAIWFAGLSEYPWISGMAAGELQFGSQSRKELANVRTFLKPFPVLWPSESDMRKALSFAELKLSDGIGLFDAITAATALGNKLTLATFNVKHFRAVPGLKTVQPYLR